MGTEKTVLPNTGSADSDRLVLHKIELSAPDDLSRLRYEIDTKCRKYDDYDEYRRVLGELRELLETDNIRSDVFYRRLKDFWKSLIGSYWHVKVYKDDTDFNDRDIQYEFYMMPYKYIDANDILFMLYSPVGDGQYEAGVRDRGLGLGDELNRTMVITRATKEEFCEQTINAVNGLIERRLNKIEYNKTHPQSCDVRWVNCPPMV